MTMILQRQAQRRHILSLIGVTPWVARNARTICIQDKLQAWQKGDALTISDSATKLSMAADLASQSEPQPVGSAPDDVTQSAAPTLSPAKQSSAELNATAPIAKTAGVAGDDSSPPKDLDVQSAMIDTKDAVPEAVGISPFTLQGVGYHRWVLLVDAAELSSSAQRLWQNIQIGLATEAEQLRFPFCQSMSTLDMANASLAGFIFKLGRSDEVQVAALSDLPDGLDHHQLVRAPRLDEMLAEPLQKRQLWQLLSN